MKRLLFLVLLQSVLPQGHTQTCGKVTDLEATFEPLRRKYFDFLQNVTNTYESTVSSDRFESMKTSLKQECNWHTTEPHGRIVGAEVAPFKPYRYVAQIESSIFCSGIILNRYWVLGSDHPRCVGHLKFIRYGLNNSLKTTALKQINLPESFNITRCGISLIKVKDNMREGEVVPVCLPWIPGNYSNCYAISVGLSSFQPRITRVTHCPQPVCEYFFKCRNITLGKNIICFRLADPKVSFDEGDSGTPIVCNVNTSNKLPYVIGVYRSMQLENAYRIFYNVNVEYYVKWIIDTLVKET